MVKRLVVLLLVLFFAGFIFRQRLGRQVEVGLKKNDETAQDVEVVSEGLTVPWEVAFLPSGEMLVTQRDGALIKIGKEKRLIEEIEGVEHVGEGGLLGLALHPDFEENGLLYLYLTSRQNDTIVNRVERYRFDGERLSERTVIVEGIKGAVFHDGGRIAFGPDGLLYITTGDAGTPGLAQDSSSLNGKILRVKDDGTAPNDNPFGNAVFSLGHRNPQGITWDTQGRFWSTEHGPSGTQSGFDEVNLIVKGGNYGWPEVKGGETLEGMILPLIQSGATDTWAPAGLIFWEGSLFFGGLRGESLYEVKNLNNKPTVISHFKGEFGRIRAAVLGPDGYFYLSTSNRDGRGRVNEGDDKIIRINPKVFRE